MLYTIAVVLIILWLLGIIMVLVDLISGRRRVSRPPDIDRSDDLFPNVRNREGTLVINDRCVVTPEGARAAIQALHAKEIGTRTLRVSEGDHTERGSWTAAAWAR